jgi:signal transduction histidine kinase
LPITLDDSVERLPPVIEATAYFVIAEALTNAVKHSRAQSAHVTAAIEKGNLQVEVRDNGVGGARLEAGSGLVGLRDRVTALGGRLNVESALGRGTVVTATLPLPG